MSASFESFSAAWERRAQRLGAYATVNWAEVCAAGSLAAYLAATALVLSNAFLWPGADLLHTVASAFLGPLLLMLAVLVLWFRSGRMSAQTALFTAVAAVPALALAALALASWSAGFTLADAGTAFGWFESSFALLAGAAWLAGALALTGPVSTVWEPRYARNTQVFLLAAAAALGFALLYLTAALTAPLAAAAVLVIALRSGAPAGVHPARRPLPDPVPASGTLRAAVAVAGFVTLILGIGFAWFALSGSSWTSLAADSTAAMNLGLAAGALNAVPVVVALGAVLMPRHGRVILVSVVLAVASLFAAAGAQLAGAGHPSQWPLSVAAGACLGFALVLPFARLLPVSLPLRVCATAGAGLAASFMALNVVAAAGFLAPLVSAALLIWCFAPPSSRRRMVQPA
ncbi:MAG: hypothetical protein ABS910_15010 [Arthrobacter sp.]